MRCTLQAPRSAAIGGRQQARWVPAGERLGHQRSGLGGPAVCAGLAVETADHDRRGEAVAQNATDRLRRVPRADQGQGELHLRADEIRELFVAAGELIAQTADLRGGDALPLGDDGRLGGDPHQAGDRLQELHLGLGVLVRVPAVAVQTAERAATGHDRDIRRTGKPLDARALGEQGELGLVEHIGDQDGPAG
jgi:hypothetical protein